MAKMTKAELVGLIQKNLKSETKKAARDALCAVVDAITQGVKKTKKVSIPELGIFEIKERKARVGRNPATGEQIQIPAKTVVKIRASKAFKLAVLGK
ncbi:MAG: HU family DNA-binding protein [Candidatus Hydrogenedentota bacterium]